MMCDSTAGKRYTGSVLKTCKNYKICFVYGAQDFCTGQIKHLKLCSTFFPSVINEYMIVSNPPQSNLPFHKIY